MTDAGAAVDHEWNAFLDELIGELPAVAADAAARITGEIEAYRRGGPPLQRAVEAVCIRSHMKLVQLWRERRDATPAETERLVQIGLPEPHSGITVEDVLHAYRVATEVLWRHFTRLAMRRPALDQTLLLDATPVGFRLMNEVSAGLTRRYLELAQRELERREHAEQAILDALFGSPPRFAEAHRIATGLAGGLSGGWWVAVAAPAAAPAEGDEGPGSLLAWVRRNVLRHGDKALTGSRDGRVVAAVSAGGLPPDEDDPWPSAMTGIGRVHDGPAGLRQSYEEATEALLVAMHRGTALVRFDGAWLDRLLLGAVSAEAFAGVVLMPLNAMPEDKRAVAVQTLRAYLDAAGSVTAAARALYVHPQTLRYRLSRLPSQITTLLEGPEGRLSLMVALRARCLYEP